MVKKQHEAGFTETRGHKTGNIFYVLTGVLGGIVITVSVYYLFILPSIETPAHLMPFQINIMKATAENQDFRHVLFTGARSQLVVMSIPPGGEVGEETHSYVEQILYFQSGTGEALLNGKKSTISPGDVVVVTLCPRASIT